MNLENWADWVLFLWFGWFEIKFLFYALVEEEEARAASAICFFIHSFLLYVVYASGAWS